MRGLRVLHVLGPAAGGMERAAGTLLAAQRAAGLVPALYRLGPPGPGWWRLPAALAAADPDVVHAHGLKAGLAAALALRRAPGGARPLAVSVHTLPGPGTPATPGVAASLVRWIHRLAPGAAFLPVSGAVAAWLAAALGPGAPLAVLVPPLAPPAALDPREARRRLGLPPGIPVVGFVGRLSPEKGLDVLLRAWARARRQLGEARLVVIGDGPRAAAWRRLSRRLGIAGDCHWLGRVPDAGALLPAFDLVAIPSRREALGLVALEALAAGVPVLAARTGGLPEALGGGRFGRLLPPGDVEAWSRALAAALAGGEPPPRPTAGAARWVGRVFAPSRVADRSARLYARLLAGTGARAGEGSRPWAGTCP